MIGSKSTAPILKMAGKQTSVGARGARLRDQNATKLRAELRAKYVAYALQDLHDWNLARQHRLQAGGTFLLLVHGA